MARRHSPERSENAGERVKEWLLKQGYPFEMWVAKVFQDCGYEVSQAEYYIDEESGKAREVDLIAELELPIAGQDKGILISLVIECKVAPNPWVVFLGTESAYPLSMFDSLVNEQGAALLSNREEFASLPFGGLVEGPSCVAYGATVAFKERQDGEQDQAYRACLTVAKAAKHHSGKEPFYLRLSGSSEWATLTFPMIVIKGCIFAASLTAMGELEVTETERARLVLNSPAMGDGAIIDVVTERHLPGLVKSFREELTGIAESCTVNPLILTQRLIRAREW